MKARAFEPPKTWLFYCNILQFNCKYLKLNCKFVEILKQENMKFKGTKGEWYVENLHEPKIGKYGALEIDISPVNGEILQMCTVWTDDQLPEEDRLIDKANALLISKAPEMLEMLYILCEELEFHGVSISKAKEARKLIKEATEI